jgi:hypothetical protein
MQILSWSFTTPRLAVELGLLLVTAAAMISNAAAVLPRLARGRLAAASPLILASVPGGSRIPPPVDDRRQIATFIPGRDYASANTRGAVTG